ELRPALDRTLMDFVEATRGQAGWPLNVVLTPEGYPLFGTTYLPKAEFLKVIQQISQRWGREHESLSTLAKNALDQWLKPAAPQSLSPGRGPDLEQAFIDQALAASDVVGGGFGNQSKFPSTPQLNALLDTLERQPNEQVQAFVGYTLFMMASQGLRDQIGGGFFRYTTDPTWQTPHFEKMLYNNALLASLYLRAAQAFKQPALRGVATDTLDFMQRSFLHPDGGYLASLSAVDDKDVEGGYYLWHADEVQELLSPEEFEIIELAWNLKQAPSFDAGYLPIQATEVKAIAQTLKLPLETVIEHSRSAREKLLKARHSRVLPEDDKRVTAWNALVLDAFVDAMEQGLDQYQPAAKALADFIINRLIPNGSLVRAAPGGAPGDAGPDGQTASASEAANETLGQAGLEDYAYTARALWRYAQRTGDEKARLTAASLVGQAWKLFESEAGWTLSARSLLPFSSAEPLIADGPMPSPSATLVALSLDMSESIIGAELHERARKALYRAPDNLTDEPYFHATHIAAMVKVEASSAPESAARDDATGAVTEATSETQDKVAEPKAEPETAAKENNE
ncbi:MAG: thioredoxin domain-containing protein, partial [Gammaproteobacteria bacterium]